MKKIITLAIALFALNIANAQTVKKEVKAVIKKSTATKSKDADGIDGRMKGPKGEKIYIGEKGGRYYINDAGNKVYVDYKGNENKSEKKAIKKVVKVITGK